MALSSSSLGVPASLSSTSSSSKVVAVVPRPKEVNFRRSICSHAAHPHTSERNTNISLHHHSIQQHPFNRLSFAHGSGFSHLSQPIYAVNSELDTSVTDMKDIGTTLRKAKVEIESRDDDTMQVRVELTGKETQKVYDDVLTNLARTAPAVPGFRRQKGGKTSNVPKEFLVRAIGEARVIKFVIQEIVSTTMTEYVEEEKLNMKKEFKTIQSPEELESQFEPGNAFGFNATLTFEKSESETPAASSSDV